MGSSATPNIVVIHCHDLGRFLGCYGIDTVSTPHLDRLAAEGVSYHNAFATAPQCSPARASLFTGRHPHTTGVMGLTGPAFGWDLHPGEQHLADMLREAGHATAMVGVHHESRTGPPAEVAERLGFDTVEPSGHGAAVTDAAIARLDALRVTAPFYLQVGYTEPHRIPGPYDHETGGMGFCGDHITPDDERGVTVPDFIVDEPSSREEIAELQGAVRHLDHQVGRFLDHLDRTGIAESTMVIFTTDHGLALPGAKGTLYDPGTEVALIIRHPAGGWTGGSRLDDLVSHVDVVPTLAQLVGLTPRNPLHGTPLPAGPAPAAVPARESVFSEITYHAYYDPRRAVRTTDWKLIANFSSAPRVHDTSQSWRPRCRPAVPRDQPRAARHDSFELYHLRRDALEQHNLADDPEHSARLRELVTLLDDWMVATGDPLRDGGIPSPIHARTRELMDGHRPLDSARGTGR